MDELGEPEPETGADETGAADTGPADAGIADTEPSLEERDGRDDIRMSGTTGRLGLSPRPATGSGRSTPGANERCGNPEVVAGGEDRGRLGIPPGGVAEANAGRFSWNNGIGGPSSMPGRGPCRCGVLDGSDTGS
ncbi:MAG: hypothetical protein ACRD0P_40485 [Stackebrandtia sp.]